MRSLIFVILSAVGLAGLFVLYWTMQPASVGGGAHVVQETVPTTMPGPRDPNQYRSFHSGDTAWWRQYDSRQQLSSQFKGDEFLPQPDGTVLVRNPVAQFFLANHQYLEIRGENGNVVIKDLPDPGRTGFTNTGPPAPPSRGRLDHVTVRLVDEAKHLDLLKMTTNNVVFDNDTFCISTEGYRDNGREIADDQVPVHVTGQIEMEGRGLTVRWNDKDGRLELLEIAHGDWLKIKNASSFSPAGAAKKAKTKSKAPAARNGRPLPDALAAKDKGAAAEVITRYPGTTTRPRRTGVPRSPHADSAPVIYQASFYDNVRVNQPDPSGRGDQILIKDVDRMDVDFRLKQSNAEPTTQPASATQPGATPATEPTSHSLAVGPQTQPAASAGPATQPAAGQEQPVFVHWTGVLRIKPLQSAPPVPLMAGDSVVTMIGSPVSIHRVEPGEQGTEDIHCATVRYQTAGEKVWLGSSEQAPQIKIDKSPASTAGEHGATHLVSTGTVQYSRAGATALLTGPGHAEVPLEPQEKEQHPVLKAEWAKQAEFDFTQPEGGKQSAIRYGHFEGDVHIEHPRLTLSSQSLELLFDSTTKQVAPTTAPHEKRESQPNLRQVIATTGVSCQTEGADGKKQTIDCDRLALDTDVSDGKLYARRINATGAVHAYGEDDLRAGYVDVLLVPSKKTPKPAKADKHHPDESAQVELEQMVARDNVIAKSKEGSTATGDELHVTTENGKQHTVLTSRTLASVTDVKGNVVKGPEIHFDSEDGKAHVVGPGSLHAVQQSSTTQPAQPVDVTWATGAEFDGAANRIDVDGNVLATLADHKGYVDTARGDHIRIDLRKKPLPPSTKPATTQPSEAGGMKMDPFKGKEVVAMTLEKDASLTSTLADPNGDIEQQFQLTSPTIVVREIAPDGTRSRSITVPAAGKMLVRDHRAPAKQPQPGDEAGGARGATAVQWSRQLIYSEAAQRADIVGDVLVVHQDDDARQLPVRMNADHLIAWFEAAPKRPPKNPQAVPANDQKEPEQSAMQLRYLTAEGSTVVITRGPAQMTARRVDEDPKRHLLIATGTDQNPVVFDPGGTAQTTALEAEWDTNTWNPTFKNAIVDYRPPTPGVQSPAEIQKKPPIHRRNP